MRLERVPHGLQLPPNGHVKALKEAVLARQFGDVNVRASSQLVQAAVEALHDCALHGHHEGRERRGKLDDLGGRAAQVLRHVHLEARPQVELGHTRCPHDLAEAIKARGERLGVVRECLDEAAGVLLGEELHSPRLERVLPHTVGMKEQDACSAAALDAPVEKVYDHDARRHKDAPAASIEELAFRRRQLCVDDNREGVWGDAIGFENLAQQALITRRVDYKDQFRRRAVEPEKLGDYLGQPEAGAHDQKAVGLE